MIFVGFGAARIVIIAEWTGIIGDFDLVANSWVRMTARARENYPCKRGFQIYILYFNSIRLNF